MSAAVEQQLVKQEAEEMQLVKQEPKEMQLVKQEAEVMRLVKQEAEVMRLVKQLPEYGINATDIEILKESGIFTVQSVRHTNITDLLKIGISEDASKKIYEAAKKLVVPSALGSALVLRAISKITTGSAAIDGLLGGGIRKGCITEIFGKIGSGKTQLCHTLSVTCQLPIERGGDNGRAIYIDCKNTYDTDQLRGLAHRFELVNDEVVRNILSATAWCTDNLLDYLLEAASVMTENRYSVLILDGPIELYNAQYVGRDKTRRQQLLMFLDRMWKLAFEHQVAVIITTSSGRKSEITGMHNIRTTIVLKKGRGEQHRCMVTDPRSKGKEVEFTIETLLEQSPSATVFAPSDSAFKKSGQPSLDLLRFHLSPLPLPPSSLRLLTAASRIPTMLPGQTLIVTTTASSSNRLTSINNINLTGSPIYDDGILLVYGIDRFFDPTFQFNSQRPTPNSDSSCSAKNLTASASDSFDQAIQTLKTGGYSAMASFLGMQLSGVPDQTGITVFAPADDMVMNRIGDFGEYPSFFRRHVVPCRLLWNDLLDFSDGSELPTFLEGFAINITRSDGVLILNGVPVFFPDVFFNDRVVVHGVSDVLAAQDNAIQLNALRVDDLDHGVEILFDPSEF